MFKLSKIWAHQSTAISNRDASNAQVTTWQTNATEKNDLVMSDVPSVVEIALRITRDVRPTKTYKRKHTTSPVETLHSSRTNQTQPGVTYAQITKQNFYSATNVEQEPHTTQPHQQTSEIQDLKNMNSLFCKWELC
jgi:hypothetical protein